MQPPVPMGRLWGWLSILVQKRAEAVIGRISNFTVSCQVLETLSKALTAHCYSLIFAGEAMSTVGHLASSPLSACLSDWSLNVFKGTK